MSDFTFDPNHAKSLFDQVLAADADGDDEAAHAAENELRAYVLEAIATRTCPAPVAWANVALSTRGLDFRRWCS